MTPQLRQYNNTIQNAGHGWTWLYEPLDTVGLGQTNTHTDKYKHNTIPTQYHPQYPLDLSKLNPKQTFLAGNSGSVVRERDSSRLRIFPQRLLLVSLAPLPEEP